MLGRDGARICKQELTRCPSWHGEARMGAVGHLSMYLFLVLLVYIHRSLQLPSGRLLSASRKQDKSLIPASEAIQAQHSALCTAHDKAWQGLWTDTVPSGQRGERSGRGGPLERSNGQPRRALAKHPHWRTPSGLKSRSQAL